MKKLKVRLWRIENVVLMKVLEQDESLRGADYIYGNSDIEIYGAEELSIDLGSIYLGMTNGFDYIAVGTITEAKIYYNKIKKVVQDYNKTLDTETKSDDIESEVVE